MFNKLMILDQVKTMLGYPVVDLAITDEMISRQIDVAVNKVVPYLNNMEVITVPSKVTKFEDKHIYTVLRVTSSNDFSNINLDKAINQGFYIVNNHNSLTSCALWNYYCDTVQDDLNQIGFRLLGDTLYIDGGVAPFTIEAITDKSVCTMTDDYVNWVLEYTTALVKCIEGEIRSKVKVTGSPIETNGQELKSEGTTEKEKLEEKLGSTIGLFYATR